MKALFLRYKEQILYLIFGVLTTLVNYVVYFICSAGVSLNWSAATVIAWVAAVTFAYLTNRRWVFESKAHGAAALAREIGLFVGARLLTLGFDWCTMYVCMEWWHVDKFVLWGLPAGEFIARTMSQIVVVILNYVFSKFFIFRDKK